MQGLAGHDLFERDHPSHAASFDKFGKRGKRRAAMGCRSACGFRLQQKEWKGFCRLVAHTEAHTKCRREMTSYNMLYLCRGTPGRGPAALAKQPAAAKPNAVAGPGTKMLEEMRKKGKPIDPKVEQMAAWLDNLAKDTTDMGEVQQLISRSWLCESLDDAFLLAMKLWRLYTTCIQFSSESVSPWAPQ